MPTLTLTLPTFGDAPAGGWRRLLDVARAAEDAGIHRVVVTDHVVHGPDVASYPWGRFPTGPDADWLEPLTVLAAIGAATERIRLATGILIVPLRAAPVLAKTVATLDVLTEGRVDLGVGTGWQAAEFEAVGVPFGERGERLTDTIAACRALWEDLPASFQSATSSFAQIYCAPRPAQERLPVWFSGSLTGRTVRRIVELGDGWIPIMGSTAEDIANGASVLRTRFDAAGRDPSALQVQAPLRLVRDDGGAVDWPDTVAGVADLVEAGVTDLNTSLMALDRHLDDPAAACAALAAAFSQT